MKKHKHLLPYLVFGLISYFLIFHKLGVHAIVMWDESLFATRAFYWAFHGEYFTNWTQVDFCSLNHPNTKPPLLSLVQAVFLKLLDYHRIGLRLPIAVLGFGLGLWIVRLFKSQLRIKWVGFAAALMLFSSYGFNQNHLLRTGDHDVALAFWLFGSLWFYFKYWLYKEDRDLLLFFVFTGLAVVTKSIMGLFFLPGIALYSIFFLPLKKEMFRNAKNWILGAIVLLLIVGSFYGILALKHEGFLQLVWDNEVGGRYTKSIDNHQQPWYHYLKLLFSRSFMPWTPLALIGAYFGYRSREWSIKLITGLMSLCALTFILVLSLAGTKLHWYLAAVYPLLACLAGLGLHFISQNVILPFAEKRLKRTRKPWWTLALYALLMVYPVSFAIDRISKTSTDYVMEQYEIAYEDVVSSWPKDKELIIFSRDRFYPNLVYLANKASKKEGFSIKLIHDIKALNKNDQFIGEYHDDFKHLDIEKQRSWKRVKLYKVKKALEN